MTEPHPTPAPHPIGDLVPGDPPVPITVWHVPTPPGTDTMSQQLALRIVHNYTRPTDLIIALTDGPQMASAITSAGRRKHPLYPRSLASIPHVAAAIVTGWPAGDRNPERFFARCATQLRPGGCLIVVVTTTDPRVQPQLIDAARTADLTYLQHIVAATNSQTPGSDLEPDGRHLRVHTDVLIFRRPRASHG